jgi:23S rRNA (cytidine1920-2'-O)/16S rRNA (cytidine1409-2'-O)-methyltransferase
MVAQGLVESRTRAASLVNGGRVRIGGETCRKPGRLVGPDERVEIEGPEHPWVSRAGVKLAAALDAFAIDPKGRVGLDIGASTGGFTQVLLARGAVRVYAVDVGHDQLAPMLRDDPRVIVLEGVNARYLADAAIPEPPGIIVCDASFIGLETILPAPLALAAPDALLVALIKPQFEVGPGGVGKGGIVRDPSMHEAVCRRIVAWLNARPGWQVQGLIPSPLPGTDGNQEFLICAHHGN